MRLIRTSEYRHMPWKNGGGETTEILVSPAGASLDQFDWRISMAKVASAGPFSLFPGVDRTLTVLEGKGLDLALKGRGDVRLDCGSMPFAFPADLPVEANLVEGPIEDLNVMTRRGRFTHRVVRLQADKAVTLPRDGDVMLVLVRGAGAAARTTDTNVHAGDGDTLLLTRTGSASVDIRPDAPLTLYVVDLWGSEQTRRVEGE
jgi:environmental stress-induced protein Ves